MNLIDWVGTVGVFTLLLAYLLVALNVLSASGLIYSVMNLVGALVAGTASYLLNYWPFIILEGAWAAVSIFSLLKSIRNRSFR